MSLPNERLKEIEELKAQVAQLYNEENYYNAMQMAAKLALNGTYGGLANKHFAGFDLNVAGSVTAMGRDLIQYMEKCNDEYWYEQWHLDTELHQKLNLTNIRPIPRDKPVSVYIDTDSLFVSFKPGMDSCDWSSDPIEFIHQMDGNRLAQYFKDKLVDYANKYRVDNIQDFERERINKSVLFMEKKRYIQNVVWEDGFDYADMSYLYSKGIELVKRSTPLFVRDKVMNIVKYLFTQGERANDQELLKLMREIKNQFRLSNIEDISMATSCNNYSIKVLDDQNKLELVSGTHIGVRAAAFHNFLLNNSPGMKSKYSTIKTGSKIKFYYTTDPRCPVFGYPYGQFPTEFAPAIDLDVQFEKTVLPIVNALTREMGLSEMNARLTVSLSLF